MAVRRRGNNWVYDIYDSNNKRLRGIVKIEGVADEAVTRKQALDYEKVLKGKVAEGVRLGSNKKDILFDKLVKEYLNWCDTNHIRNDRDHSACKSLLKQFGGYKASKISLWLIEGYKKKRKDEGKSHRTINIELAALRQMYNKAIEWKLLTINPLSDMSPKKHFLVQEIKERRIIDTTEFEKLYINADEVFRPFLLFAYLTGCRPKEIMSLTWENVDLKNRYVLITKTKIKKERKVFLANRVIETLQLLNDNSNSNNYHVFLYDGKPFNNTTLRKCWEKTYKKSGIKKCVFYNLRHSFCSNLLVNEGVDVKTVASMSGHSVETLLKFYAKTNDIVKKEAIEKLDKYVNFLEYSHKMVTNTNKPEDSNASIINLTHRNH